MNYLRATVLSNSERRGIQHWQSTGGVALPEATGADRSTPTEASRLRKALHPPKVSAAIDPRRQRFPHRYMSQADRYDSPRSSIPAGGPMHGWLLSDCRIPERCVVQRTEAYLRTSSLFRRGTFPTPLADHPRNRNNASSRVSALPALVARGHIAGNCDVACPVVLVFAGQSQAQTYRRAKTDTEKPRNLLQNNTLAEWRNWQTHGT
jgi:hypothetical protein